MDEEHHDFPDEFYKFLFNMGVTMGEKDELSAYEFKDVPQTWYTQ